MRIDNAINGPYLVRISTPTQAAKAAPAERAQGAGPDRVELSSRVKEIAALKKELAALPDVRADRVALARQQLQYGPYRVDANLVAQKIMKDDPEGNEP